MKLLLKYIFGLIFIFFTAHLNAQILTQQTQKWEVGLWGGTSNYFGDIKVLPEYAYTIFRPAAGVFGRYNINPRIAINAGLNYGSIVGDDAYSPDDYERIRNLSFQSNIYEVSTALEFNFFPLIIGSYEYFFTPYMFIGISGFHFNPKAELDGRIYELQPLGTEGQNFSQFTGREPYNLFGLAIPLGGGIKYNFANNFTLGFKVGYRFTFTDYLDDISTTYADPSILTSGNGSNIVLSLADRSPEVYFEPIGSPGKQRGNSKNNDAYLFSGITFSYTFTSLKCPPPSGSILNRR